MKPLHAFYEDSDYEFYNEDEYAYDPIFNRSWYVDYDV